MDYEEKYKEARERARQFFEKPYLEDSAGIVGYIFPELKESEDEKIRKTISVIIKDWWDRVYRTVDFSKEELLAWLEKQGQGEQKPIKSLVDSWKEMRLEIYAQASGNRPCNVSDDNTKMFSLNDVDEIIEKIGDCQIEQKPAEWSEEDREYMQSLLDIINGTPSLTPSEVECHKDWLKSLKDRVLPQPKQEWSEENESRMENLCHFLKEYGNQYYGALTLEGTINWLKSLKDRIQPQLQQEWNEEDERNFNTAIQHIEEYVNNTPSSQRPEIWADINKLKSLRPQSIWKPSEEMLEALYRATPKNVMAISEDEMLLDKLYQGLKYGRILS